MKEEKTNIGTYECTIRTGADDGTVVSVYDDVLRVDMVKDIRFEGDEKTEDCDKLLRFNVYVRNPEEDEDGKTVWIEIEDASQCTLTSLDTEESLLRKVMGTLFGEFRNVIGSYEDYLNGASITELSKQLSWICGEWFINEG